MTNAKLIVAELLYVTVPCVYFISDKLQDVEKDKEETEYMLQENGKPMYEIIFLTDEMILLLKKKKIGQENITEIQDCLIEKSWE